MQKYGHLRTPLRDCDFDLIEASVAIQERDPWCSDEVAFMPKHLVITTLPHRKVAGSEFTRKNGAYELSVLTPSSVGIPYGILPRLIMVWLTSEAVKTKCRQVELGESLSEFMRRIDLTPTGGRNGSITRLKDQVRRLFSSTISLQHIAQDSFSEAGYRIADQHMIYWSSTNPDQAGLWNSSVTLSEAFYSSITNNPVPLDLGALRALKSSPMAFDIYCWMTHRFFWLRSVTRISWKSLNGQFGTSYSQGRDFRRSFVERLNRVSVLYPEARFKVTAKELILYPSKTHVSQRSFKGYF